MHPFCLCTCLSVILGKFQFLPVCQLTIDVIFNNNKTRRRYFLAIQWMYWCFSSTTKLSMKSGKKCLFGFFFCPTREFFSHLEMSPLPLKACTFYLCSALMAIELWGIFSMPHLLWHGPTLHNGHLRGPVTLTTVVERLAVELSLTCFNRQAVPTGDRTPIGANVLTLGHRGG